MKRLLACIMAGTLLTGCAVESKNSASGDSGDNKEVITVWAWDKNFNIRVMEEAEKIYEADHPDVDIQIVDYGREDIEKKMHTTLSTGSTKNLPDIVLIEDYTAQKFLTSYPGMFEELTEHFSYNDFAQYKLSPMTVGGEIYGVPFDSGVTAMFYRTDYLEQAGYSASDLENITWERYIEIGKDVYEKTGKHMAGDDLNEMSGLARIMLQSANQWYFDENGELTITNNKALKEVFDLFVEMKNSGIVKNTSGWDAWVGAMNDGSVASVVSGSWIMASIMAGEDQAGKWAVAPTPKLSTVDSVNASNIGGSSWYVLGGKDTGETAIDFMKSTFGQNEEFYQTILTNVGAIGTYIPAQDGAAYSEASEYFSGQTIYQDFSAWMQEIPRINYGVYVGEADNAVHSIMPDLMSGKLTSTQAMEKLESALQNQVK